MVGVLVVLEHFLHVHGPLATRLEDLREPLGAELRVDVHAYNGPGGPRWGEGRYGFAVERVWVILSV